MDQKTPSATLTSLFEAEREVRRAHAELLLAEHGSLVTTLAGAVREALALGDTPEAALRLVRVGDLLGELHGPEAVDALIDVLGGKSAEGRGVAGESLVHIAFDRFKEVALGIERALLRLPKDSPALSELPYLIAEVGEPGCVKLIGKFLTHADPNVVSSGIEALAEMGDPSAISLLTPLEKDSRQVDLDEDDAEGRVSLGELAHEAVEILTEIEKKSAPPARKNR